MKYVIIKIWDNYLKPDGHALIVKANPVEDNPGFEELSKMFGKTYCTYSTNEGDETEIFIFPYSKERLNSLIRIARGIEENRFWSPNMLHFYDSRLKMSDGTIHEIHKSIDFRKF